MPNLDQTHLARAGDHRHQRGAVPGVLERVGLSPIPVVARRRNGSRDTSSRGYLGATVDATAETWRVWGAAGGPTLVPDRTTLVVGGVKYRVQRVTELVVEGVAYAHDLEVVRYAD